MTLKKAENFADKLVMDKKLLKVMRRSSFTLISFGFLLIGGLSIFLLYQTEKEQTQSEIASREIFHIKENLVHGQVIMGHLREVNKGLKPTKEFRRHWNEFIPQLNSNVESLFSINSTGIFGSLNLSSLLYSNKWHLDQTLQHDLKLKKTLLQMMGREKQENFQILFKEVEKHSIKSRDQLKPFEKELEKNIDYLKSIKRIVLVISALLFLSLMVTIYIAIYRPWKASYLELESEKRVLQDVLRESELRGNTFSWEVNYNTKIVKRSEQLEGIFVLDDKDNDENLFTIYDEYSLFRDEFQRPFEVAFETCATKGEILDIQVGLQARNGKVYWFHYYAKRVEDGKEVYVKGTIRDISKQKLAETRFKKIFEVYENPCLIFGEGQVRTMNDAALKFLGVESMDQFDRLHPAILFPLYQMDGNSSLQKLKQILEEVRDGKTSIEDWSFQTRRGRDVIGRTTILHLPYADTELFLMIINDDSQKFEFERRLVDANRRALQARRLKLEYVTQVGIVLQDMSQVVKDEIKYSSDKNLGHLEKLEKIQAEVQKLWEENLSQSMDETSNIHLTNVQELVQSLSGRWIQMAEEFKCEFSLSDLNFTERYFWLDSAKLRLAIMALVEGAISTGSDHNVNCTLEAEFKGGRHGKLRLFVKTDNPNWPGEDWQKLVVTNREDREGSYYKPLSLANFFNIIEILQGEVFVEKSGNENCVGFEFYIERAVGLTSEDISRTYHGFKDEGQSFTISASDIWSHFGGDWDVIENTIKDFLDYYPTALADLLYYLRNKDSQELVNTATDLYGVLSHFPFFNSIERVIRIQKYSKFLKFDHVEDEIEALSYDLSLFARALQDFLPEEKRLVS